MFPNIVVLAGLMQPLQLSLTESRSPERPLGPISTFLLKSSFLVSRKMMGAMEVSQSMPMSGCTITTSQMRLVQFIMQEDTIME